jgi:mono/diheme cytochrome c family protein
MLLRHLTLSTALILATALPAAAADGAAIYKDQCAKCHGDTGAADTTIGKAMKVPPLAGDAKIQKMSASDVAAVIKGNAKHPPAVKALSDEDINAVAAEVKKLAGGN